MGGLGIAFRRRTQYKKKVEKVEIDIYTTLTLTDGAQIALSDIFFNDNLIRFRASFNVLNNLNLGGVDLVSGTIYSLGRHNTGQNYAFSNGATSVSQKYLYGFGTSYPRIYEWNLTGVFTGDTTLLIQERVSRLWSLLINAGTTFYYLDVYDSTGTNLLHSLKPALLNKETPGLWDEVNQKFYGMTSETGTLTLA